MEEPLPASIPETPPPPSTSLLSRMTNVFVSPGEVFDEIKSSKPMTANWVVPLVLAMTAGVIYTMVVFSQPAIIKGMQDVQEKAVQAHEKSIQAMVASGKMTQAKADETIAMAQKLMGPGVVKITGSLGAIVANAAMLFLTGLIFWAVGLRALHGNFSYMKAVEAVGLANMINVLGAVVAMLLAVIYGNMSITPGPVLLVIPFDAANKLHRILSALNVMSFWYVAVLAIALAKLSGASFAKAALWLFGIWAVYTFLPVLVFGGK